MQLDKLTEKSREALQAANTLAEHWTNPEIEPEHLERGARSQREQIGGHSRQHQRRIHMPAAASVPDRQVHHRSEQQEAC